MKTSKKIKIVVYPVKLKDNRTGEHLDDLIVLDADWLRICGSEGLNICDDKHMIYRACNLKGYEVLEIGKRRKVQLDVDLEELYRRYCVEQVTDREGVQEK